MKRNKKMTETVVGANSVFSGKLAFDGSIQVDGNVAGHIESETGVLIIGEGAKVVADITAGIVVIRGEVVGTIRAVERVEAYAPGHIEGDIFAPVIAVDKGVVFNGSCEMTARTIIRKKTPLKTESPKHWNGPSNIATCVKTG